MAMDSLPASLAQAERQINQRSPSQASAAIPTTIRYQAKGAKPWREM
jgi:hypothetical protein